MAKKCILKTILVRIVKTQVLLHLTSYSGKFLSIIIKEEFVKGVIERGNAYLIIDNGELIFAGATVDPITDDRISVQLTITNVEKIDGWKALLVELARIFQEKGHGEKKLIVTPDLEPEQIKFYEDNNAEIWSDYINYNIL